MNAQSPFNRMGQHLGSAKNSSMLRNHLTERGVVPEECAFRLIAHGPILPETADWDTHCQRRDAVGAVEKKLAEDLTEADYDVMNTINCLKPLDEDLYAGVRAAFAPHFTRLDP
jgi:hypothetical protein